MQPCVYDTWVRIIILYLSGCGCKTFATNSNLQPRGESKETQEHGFPLQLRQVWMQL